MSPVALSNTSGFSNVKNAVPDVPSLDFVSFTSGTDVSTESRTKEIVAPFETSKDFLLLLKFERVDLVSEIESFTRNFSFDDDYSSFSIDGYLESINSIRFPSKDVHEVDDITTPALCEYVEASIYNDDYSGLIIAEGDDVPVYEDYYEELKDVRTSSYEIEKEFSEDFSFSTEADVIAATSQTTVSFNDITMVGAKFNTANVSFNAIKLPSAGRGVVAYANKWAFVQVFIRNTKTLKHNLYLTYQTKSFNFPKKRIIPWEKVLLVDL